MSSVLVRRVPLVLGATVARTGCAVLADKCPPRGEQSVVWRAWLPQTGARFPPSLHAAPLHLALRLQGSGSQLGGSPSATGRARPGACWLATEAFNSALLETSACLGPGAPDADSGSAGFFWNAILLKRFLIEFISASSMINF